ncbi:hypothetical protein GJ496_007847 [Pomphorhynchus laevis]|nr:hypothetical protein GJ496_007847 [Pomphorhynchus laevis]
MNASPCVSSILCGYCLWVKVEAVKQACDQLYLLIIKHEIHAVYVLPLKAATDRQQIQQQNQQQILNAVNSNAQLINISSHNIPEQIKHKLSTRSPSIPTRQISADQRTHNYQDLQPRSQQRPQISTQLAYDAFRTSSHPMQRSKFYYIS